MIRTSNFWRKHYYPSLLEVVAEAKSKLDRVDWTPSLSPEVEGTQDEIEERARLLSLIAPHQGEQAEAKVKELWTVVYDSSDAQVQEVLSRTQPPSKFYQKALYEVLQELLGEGVGERKEVKEVIRSNICKKGLSRAPSVGTVGR